MNKQTFLTTILLKFLKSQHIYVSAGKAKTNLSIHKALTHLFTSTELGRQKELIISGFKAITPPILEYANTIPYTSINKQQNI